MPPKGISDDLKSHIPVLYGKGYAVKDICHLLSIKKTLAYKVLNQYHRPWALTYSCLVRSPCSLHPADFAFISAVVNHRPSIYLDELKEQLSLQHNVDVSIATLASCTLRKLSITCKVVSAHAQEQNDLAREMYMNKITASSQ